ncbi:F-box/FBD/LRR-repeat protein [Senna tora]|uniref:F-box/FBD/LRR-repeat protein n=1 Tax=Senna tora TaxID=362788 RepID=A0A834TWB9_9FABA|nr:F-box/FBD/LRR-repeat protein [Senna tora]
MSSLVMSCRIEKADRDMPVDLISDLPRNVIDCILRHLPIRDLVRTSILSRKWRYMWLTVPSIEFDHIFFKNILTGGGHLKDHEIPSVITEVLFLHDGPLEKFYLVIPHNYPTRVRCLSQWILYLSRSGIKELELKNCQEEPYKMPSHLFSCLHLNYLGLGNFTLRPPPDFGGFKSLIGLNMCNVIIESNILESFISSCPLLEELTISYCFGFDSLNISSPNLRILLIEGSGVLKSICLKKLNNLVDLTIILERSMENLDGGRRSNLVDFFSSLPNIEKLRLVDGYIKFLSTGSIQEKLSMMIYSLKHLVLHEISFTERGQISLLVCLLKSSPNLVEFEITIHNLEPGPIYRIGEFIWNGYSLNRLRTVNIRVNTIFHGAVDLAEYLLKYSPVLEILTFKIDGEQSDAGEVLGVTQDLLQIRRKSPKAEVIFLCDGFF